MVTVTVTTATTVISSVIIGPSFPPGQEIPRSANHRPWCVRDAQVRPIRFPDPFGKPHLELVGAAQENIRRIHAGN